MLRKPDATVQPCIVVYRCLSEMRPPALLLEHSLPLLFFFASVIVDAQELTLNGRLDWLPQLPIILGIAFGALV